MEDPRKNSSARKQPCHHKYKQTLIFHGVKYFLTMILVFKQIYNTFVLKKTMMLLRNVTGNADDVSN